MMDTVLEYTESAVFRAFAVVGCIYVFLKIFSFTRVILSLFVVPGASLSKFGPRGSWALVTGASDGIGKEFASQLAAKGFNVVLVSRTQAKLENLAKELEEKHASVQTQTLAMDFARDDDADYERLSRLVKGLDIAILVNNVGLSHSIPVPFLETPAEEMFDIITINCTATLKVTQIVAVGMVQRRRGLILTMASFGGILPTPLLATYSGSKAFLQNWSTALGSELGSSGVHVHLIQSYLVTSAMSKIRRASALIPSPKTFVGAALSKIQRSGGAQGIAYTGTPYWAHGLMHWGLETFVGTKNGFVVDQNRVMHEQIRKRALKKKEQGSRKNQ